MLRGAVAVRGGDAHEVAAGRGRGVVRLRSRRRLDAAGVAGARADIALQRERRAARIELLEPFGRGYVGLGRDPALRRRIDRLVGVHAPIAEELVEALARGVAEGIGERTDHAGVLVARA